MELHEIDLEKLLHGRVITPAIQEQLNFIFQMESLIERKTQEILKMVTPPEGGQMVAQLPKMTAKESREWIKKIKNDGETICFARNNIGVAKGLLDHFLNPPTEKPPSTRPLLIKKRRF